jgi:Phosphotransferase enzyme family
VAPPLTPWSDAAWLAEATSWLDARLDASGQRRIGPVAQPHVRPWGTALCAPTTAGRVWLKASGPGNAFEARLYAVLMRTVPDDIVVPLAVDTERAWMLLPDGGPSLADRLSGRELVDAVVAAVTEYVRMQRVLAGHVGELLATGVLDLRPALLPQRFDEALDWVGDLVDPRVRQLRPQVAAWGEQLAAAPGAPSLDHNDLHGWNILGSPGRIRFYDWGDSVIGHPFASVLVPMGSVDPDDRSRVRDAFLDGYSDLGTRAELIEIAELACRSAHVARTLANKRAVVDPTWDECGEPGWHYLNALVG